MTNFTFIFLKSTLLDNLIINLASAFYFHIIVNPSSLQVRPIKTQISTWLWVFRP